MTAKRRRVAVFRQTFLPPSETFVRDHLLNLPTWEPVAVTLRRAPQSLAVPGVEIVDATRARGFNRVIGGVARRVGASRVATRVRQRAFVDALRRQDVRLVHAHFGPDAAVVREPAEALGLPLVATFHGYDASMWPEDLAEIAGGKRMLRDWSVLMDQVAAIITVSGFLRDELVARGADAAKINVIPCGVDTANLRWTPPPADGGLLFVGRLVEKKGGGDFIEAVANLPRAPRARVIGDGPLRSALEEKARQLGAKVEFLGVCDSSGVQAAMSEASIVVMPSRRATSGDAEGLPVVSLEASALGRPVVGYAHSGLVESVVSGETGALVAEGDVLGLTDRIAGLLGDHRELGRLAVNARSHVEDHFDLSDCLGRVEGVYEAASGSARAI